MPITVTVDLLARPRGVSSVRITDEGESLRSARFPIFSQENSSDTAVFLEDIAEVVFFGEFGDLFLLSARALVPSPSRGAAVEELATHVCNPQRSKIIPLVLATHLLPRNTPLIPQMRRHISSPTGT